MGLGVTSIVATGVSQGIESRKCTIAVTKPVSATMIAVIFAIFAAGPEFPRCSAPSRSRIKVGSPGKVAERRCFNKVCRLRSQSLRGQKIPGFAQTGPTKSRQPQTDPSRTDMPLVWLDFTELERLQARSIGLGEIAGHGPAALRELPFEDSCHVIPRVQLLEHKIA